MPPALSDAEISEDEGGVNGDESRAPTAIEADVKAKNQMKDDLIDNVKATSSTQIASRERRRVSLTNSNSASDDSRMDQDNRTKGIGKSKARDDDSEDDDEEEGEEEEDAYEVEAIVGHEFRKKKGKNQPYILLYNVKWKGYPKEDNTLEPEENLSGSRDILAAYQHALGGTPQPPSSASLSKKKSSRSMREVEDKDEIDTPPAKRQRQSKNTDQALSADDDLGKFGDWRPSSTGNWEKQIKTIETVERDEKSNDLVIYLRWKNGKGSKIKNNLVRDKAPQTLIDFYEKHLNFSASTES